MSGQESGVRLGDFDDLDVPFYLSNSPRRLILGLALQRVGFHEQCL